MVCTKLTKIVVTNQSALRRKYGAGHRRVLALLRELRRVDRQRGIETHLVRIDVAKDMRRYQTPSVRKSKDDRAVKEAVDAVCRVLSPCYVLIVGGPDIVPQQSLKRGLDTSDDAVVPSDLPYACEQGYSDDARAFIDPSRLVGRVAGITGLRDPQALLSSLRTACGWRPRASRDYSRALAVSVKIWANSTRLSLRNVFGHADDLQLVPPKTFRWSKRLISRRAHYLNCHGIFQEDEFEGQEGDSYPLAHTSRYVAPRIRPGTVAAVEACYGALLYDPQRAGSNEPMVNAYLRHGAYAYFGSSTSTFGPSTGNACADLICQSFLRHLRLGVSAGRAALEARIDYLKSHPTLAPVDHLTLAQFGLFGDPSVHPVLPSGVTCPRVGRIPSRVHEELSRRALEQHVAHVPLRVSGHESAVVEAAPGQAISDSVARLLRSNLERAGGREGKIRSFVLKPQRARPGVPRALGGGIERSVHVVQGESGKDSRGRSSRVLVVAQSEGRRVVSVRVLHSKGREVRVPAR
jgi:hypothetical protein